MVHIDNPVGRGAASAKHDVAVIQAALKNIKVGGKSLWPGRIDGSRNNALYDAIEAFQVFKRITVNGKVEKMGTTINALNSVLPRNLVNMRGVKGTCAVYVSPLGARDADREARGAKANAPFPAAESAGLATILTNVGRQFGICLEVKREFVTPDGRFAVEMDFMKVQWIDNGGGRLLPAGRESRGAIQAVCRLVQSVPAWAVGSSSDLVFTSTRQVPALKGIGPATPADLKALGLKQMPKHEVLQAIVAACAKLVRGGVVATKSGRAEHRILRDAVSSVDKSLAAWLETVAMICQPLKVDLLNLAIQEDNESKRIMAASDALAVRSKELGIIAEDKLAAVKFDLGKTMAEHEISRMATSGAKFLLNKVSVLLSLASTIMSLSEIDRVLREDKLANLHLDALNTCRTARDLTLEEKSAVIERRKELGCP